MFPSETCFITKVESNISLMCVIAVFLCFLLSDGGDESRDDCVFQWPRGGAGEYAGNGCAGLRFTPGRAQEAEGADQPGRQSTPNSACVLLSSADLFSLADVFEKKKK